MYYKRSTLLFILILISCLMITDHPLFAKEYTKYGVYYSIPVRCYYDTDGDGIGDLKGIIAKLDYLNDGKPEAGKDLGITGIYLMGLLESPSEINNVYGTLEDLKQLIKEAHSRGIKVIIDLPVKRRDKRDFFEQLFTISYDINKIVLYWLRQGLDGFCLCSPDQDEENNPVDLRIELAKIDKNFYLIGDIKEAEGYFDSVFNYSAAELILESIRTGNITGFNEKLDQIYDISANYIDAPLLGNQEQKRVMSEFDGEEDKARIAASVYLTLPGNPFIYYGEEIGMEEEIDGYRLMWEGGFSTVEEQVNDRDSLLNHYRSLIKLRQSYPVLTTGGIIFLEPEPDLISYIRYYPDDQYLYIYHNIGKKDMVVRIDKGANWRVIYHSNQQPFPPTSEDNSILFQLPPYSSIILKKE